MKDPDETQAISKAELLDQLQARAQLKLRSTVRFARNVRKATQMERPAVTEADLEDSKDEPNPPGLEGLVSACLAFCLLMMAGCCVQIRPAFAAYHEALAPEYRAYVEEDARLDARQKASRYDMLDAADAALKESE